MNEESLFAAAMDKSTPAEREAFLIEACGNDSALRQRMEILLVADEHGRGILERGPHDAFEQESHGPLEEPPIAEGPGDCIGPYKLKEKIGEGGFGLVFVAEQQQPIRRKVALKIIRPGMDTREVIARFEAERQALAMMDHPNIAKVLDAGATGVRNQETGVRSSDAGRAFFVMELVRGLRITEYCDREQFTTRERLELFIPLCLAVQHAHQKGIIHRDLKPSNVLVTSHDGRPVVKVIDFGVAKALNQQLTEHSVYTGFTQMIGTPAYMSPEQAEISGLDVDTRSDVYSLGVLLYELLTGTTPFDRKRLATVGFDEMRRIIREEEPERPSTRLCHSQETLVSVSAQRKTEPAKLTKLVRGELDWIVMKALEKDRSRRYETASDFARDVQRYLADEPVLACPPSLRYRFRKFARRNKVPMLAASLVFVALVIGVIGTTLGLVRAERQRQIAQDNEQKAVAAADAETKAKRSAEAREAETKAVLEFVEKKILAAARPEVNGGLGSQVSLQRAIKEALLFVENSFKDEPLIEARLRVTIGWSFYLLHTKEGYNAAAEQFRSARVLYATHRGADHIDSIRCGVNQANAYDAAGRIVEAIVLLEETLPLLRVKLGPDHTTTLLSMKQAARNYRSLGRHADALRLEEEGLTVLSAKLGRDHPDTVDHMRRMSMGCRTAGQHEDALRLGTELLSAYGTNPGRNRPDAIANVRLLADTYVSLGRHAEAILIVEEWLPRLMRSKDGPEAHNDLWRGQETHERYVAAIRQLGAPKLRDDIVAICKAKDGPDHPSAVLLASLQTLARRCTFLGQHSEAVRLDEEVLAMHRAKFGPDDPATYQAMEHLGVTYSSARRHAEAVKVLEERVARHVAKLGPDHLDTLPGKSKLAVRYSVAGRHADALKLHQEVLALRRSKLGPDHPDTIGSMHSVILFLVKLKRGAEALPLINECTRHADRKDVDSTMIPSVMRLRLEHFETVRDAAGCRETAELWEKLNRTDADSLYTAARMRAVTAAVMRRADPKAGLRAEDAVAEANRAMAWLKQAVAGGFNRVAAIRDNPDFRDLRDRDDFKMLVTNLAARKGDGKK